MSTILKALRKLEREKTTPAEGRSLREAVATGGAEPSGGSTQPIWLVPSIALLLGIAVGAGFLWLWPTSSAEESPASQVARVAVAPIPQEQPSAPRVDPEPVARKPAPPALPSELRAPAQEAGLPAAAFSSQVEVVDRPARAPRIEAPAQPVEAPELAPQRVIAQVEAVPSEPDPWLVEPGAPRAPLSAVELPVPPTLAVEAPVETLDPVPSPPQAVEPPIPTPTPPVAPAAPVVRTLRVDRTWWHPRAGRRSALVYLGEEELRVGEGELVGDAVVTTIEPSAVVFTRGVTEFRRQVGGPAAP